VEGHVVLGDEHRDIQIGVFFSDANVGQLLKAKWIFNSGF